MRSRRTGARYETECLKEFLKNGFDARKTAASGAMQGYQGDIEVDALGGQFNCEVKYSTASRGTALIRRYLEGVQCLFMRSPGEKWIVVLEVDMFFKLLKGAQRQHMLERAKATLKELMSDDTSADRELEPKEEAAAPRIIGIKDAPPE